MGIGVKVGVGVMVGAKLVWGTGARTMVLSSWRRTPPRVERPVYNSRKPRLVAGVGVERGPGETAGISALPSKVADTANRMTIKWEVKRERKSPSPTLAIEVRILVLETQSLALDQRVAQCPIRDSLSVSPAGGKSAGISIRSPLLRQIIVGRVALSPQIILRGHKLSNRLVKWSVSPIVLSPTGQLTKDHLTNRPYRTSLLNVARNSLLFLVLASRSNRASRAPVISIPAPDGGEAIM